MVAVQSYPQPPDRDFPNMSLDRFRVVLLILETDHSRPPFSFTRCISQAPAPRKGCTSLLCGVPSHEPFHAGYLAAQ